MKCFLHLPLLCLGAVLLTATGQVPLDARQALLDAHNDWRAAVALGFRISNMKQVVWSSELATHAQTWAETCFFGGSAPSDRIRATSGWSQVGEIVLGQRGSLEEVGVVQLVGKEFTEGREVFGSDLAGDCSSVSNATQRARCERFLQLIWPRVSEIGCGAAFCPFVQNTEEFRTSSVIVVCNYAPGGGTGLLSQHAEEGGGCESCSEEEECYRDYLCSATGSQSIVAEPPDPTPPPPQTPRVSSISPNYGSFKGRTQISIIGQHFSSDQFSYTNPLLGNKVMLHHDDYPSMECPVVTYDTNPGQIVCITPAAPVSVATDWRIQVFVNGLSIEELGGRYCGGSCNFRYRNWNVPVIWYVTPAGPLGNPLLIHGHLYTVEFYKSDEENPDGPLIKEILMGAPTLRCSPMDDDEVLPAAIDEDSNVGNVTCLPTVGNAVGSYNVDLVIQSRGSALLLGDRLGVDARNFEPYLHQTHPEILSVSPREGSIGGGTLVTITGTGFYPDQLTDSLKVTVGGVECRVTNMTATEIQCISGPRPQELPYYTGGRGLLRELWDEEFRWSLSHIPSLTPASPGYRAATTDIAWMETGYPSPLNETTLFMQKVTGFLVPPTSGTYTLYVRSDDLSQFSLSTTADPANLSVVASARQWTRNRWDYFATQRSEPMELEGGKPYYLEVLHVQGGGPYDLLLGLKFHNSNKTRGEVPAEHEVQTVVISSTIVMETHEARLYATPQLIQAAITCAAWPDCYFSVSFNATATTGPISTSASAAEIEAAINGLEPLQQHGVVTVDASNDTGSQLTLNITFYSIPATAGLLTVDNTSSIGVDSEYPTGITLSFGGGRTSSPMMLNDITETATRAAILELSSWQCTNNLDRSVGAVFWSKDYEGDSITDVGGNRGNVDTSVEPFCGRGSLRSPRHLFLESFSGTADPGNGFPAAAYRYLCFAHLGAIPNNRLHALTRYNRLGTVSTRYFAISLDDGSDQDELFGSKQSGWRYSCVNLYEFFTVSNTVSAEGTEHIVLRFSFDYPAGGEDFWVDSVSVTQSMPAVTDPSIIQTSPAVRPGGVIFDDVRVAMLKWPPEDLFGSLTQTVNRTRLAEYLSEGSNTSAILFPIVRLDISYSVHECAVGIPLPDVQSTGGCGQECVTVVRSLNASGPIGGNFTLRMEDGTAVSGIPATASASQLQAMLEESTAKEIEFDVEKRVEKCFAAEWSIEWKNRGGDQAPLTADGQDLKGVGVAIEVVEDVHGGILFRPIRGDMLRLPKRDPQVEVCINKIPASCPLDNCGFNFTEEVTPQLHSSSPAYGSAGVELMLIGQGFTLGDGNLAVAIGNADCAISDYNDTHITCTAGPHQAGMFRISVLVSNVGYAHHSYGGQYFDYQLQLDSLEPTSGSIGGGALLTLHGNGFPDMQTHNETNFEANFEVFWHFWRMLELTDGVDFPCGLQREFRLNTRSPANETDFLYDKLEGFKQDFAIFHYLGPVQVGDFPCMLVNSTLSEMTCVTPPHSDSAGGVVNVTICVNGEASHLADAFTYSPSLTPVLTQLNPSSTGVLRDTVLSLTGRNLNISGHPEVFLVDGNGEMGVPCEVESVDEDSVLCWLNGSDLAPGEYRVGVVFPGVGYPVYERVCPSAPCNDTLNTPFTFSVELYISSVEPPFGSTLGGTQVTVLGGGFPSSMDDVAVTIGNRSCEVTAVNSSHIQCWTPALQETFNGFLAARQPLPWTPANLSIYQGDSVYWKWSGAEFDLQQLASTDGVTPMLPGFRADRGLTGSLTVEFLLPGQYHYGGFVDLFSGQMLRGTITVAPRNEEEAPVIVSVGGYNTYSDRDGRRKRETAQYCPCADLCYPSDSAAFTYSPCATPHISDISPLELHLHDIITLSSEGNHSNMADVTVTLVSPDGTEHHCSSSNVTEAVITCEVLSFTKPPMGVPLTVKVGVAPYGNALVATAEGGNTITLLPEIRGVFPPIGSTEGGAQVVMFGVGLSGNVTVTLEGLPCYVTHNDYYSVTCLTPTADIAVTAMPIVTLSLPAGDTLTADCDNSTSYSCKYEFSSSATPLVEDVIPTSISSAQNETLTLSGVLLPLEGETFDRYRPEPLNDSQSRNNSVDGDSGLDIVFFPYTEGMTAEGYFFAHKDEFSEETERGPRFVFPTCALLSLSNSSVECLPPPLPAGDYALVLRHRLFGYAQFANESIPVITIQPEITGVSPSIGSTHGGTSVEILGGGFSPVWSDIIITMDTAPCRVTFASYSRIVCQTSAHASGTVSGTLSVSGVVFPVFSFTYSSTDTPVVTSITPDSGNHGDTVVLNVTNIPSGAVTDVVVGGVRCRNATATTSEITCTLGVNYVGTHAVRVLVDPIGFAVSDVSFTYNLVLSSNAPTEGSLAGMSELTILGTGFDPVQTMVTVCGEVCPQSATPTTISEIHCILPPNSNVTVGSGGYQPCDVHVTSRGVTEVLAGGFTYRDDLTPIISWVQPQRGGSAGGTHITIYGSGFDAGNVTVTIAGTPCEVTDMNSTHLTCRTGASRTTITAPVRVYVEGQGFAFPSEPSSTVFRYVDLWSSRFTWGGEEPPVAGDFVIVPKGQTLSIDVDTPVLTILLIDGGTVLFDDNQNVSLHSEHILVVKGGLLQVGTEDSPFQHHAEIVLYGHPLSTELPLFGAKTLAVREGTLDLHGKPLVVTWTWLAATVEPGATEITLQQAVDWEVGGRIVIASTSFSQRENEEAEIVAIDSTRTSLTVSRIPRPDEEVNGYPVPLKYRHISVQQTVGGVLVETRAEVGYLTRNVVVRGNRLEDRVRVVENCEAGFNVGMFDTQTCFEGRFGSEIVDDQFGSQIMLHAARQDEHLVTGRIEYVEVTHAGQAFQLGRYPIHYHLNGNVSGSYVRGCAIHHTFNRAVTVHAVNYLLVERNVAFNVLGHAFFLEDGVEEYNVIQDNLGVFVRGSSSLLNVDITPATFWIVNPRNIVRRNAAAGGSHFGFWYRLEQHPSGPSFTTTVCPRKIPLLEFSNNSAHSFGWYGLWVFPQYHPTVEGTCGGKTPGKVEFTDFLSWRNQRGVEFTEVGSLQLKDSVMLDNTLAGIEVVDLSQTCWGDEGPLIENVIVVGHTDAIDEEVNGFCTDAGIKTPKSDFLTVSNVTFINFDRTACRAIRACAHCKFLQGGFETRFRRIEFENSQPVTKWQWPHEHVHTDLDGSLTGTPGGSLLPYNPTLPPDHCVEVDSSEQFPSAHCGSEINFQRVAIDTVLPPSLESQALLIAIDHPDASNFTRIQWRIKRLSRIPGLMAVLPLGYHYNLQWEDGGHLTNITYTAHFNKMAIGDHLWFNHRFPLQVDRVSIDGVTESSPGIPLPDINGNGDWIFNEETRTLTYLIEGSSDDACTEGADNNVRFDSYKCAFLDCIPPPPPEPPTLPPLPNVTYFWSNLSLWGGSYPQEDDDVFINCSWHVVVDTDIPRLGTLEICGVLELDSTRNHSIEAVAIVIKHGQLVVGRPGTPYEHEAVFTLHGDIDTPEYPVPLTAPAVGSKAIASFGQLILHGSPPMRTWTYLDSTVNPQDRSLTVSDSVDWKVGDKIVITSTSYEPLEAETFQIAAISDDGRTISIDGKFQFKHSSDVQVVGAHTAVVRAEVGLLTRNIRIQNGKPSKSNMAAFGCRVLVGHLEEDGMSFVGNAQIEGVEFDGCGQIGYTFTRDPRFALAFLNTGEIVNSTSYVRKSSFHDGYNTAIGAFGVSGLSLEDNVIHNQVGHSVWMEGAGHVLRNNLAGVALFPGLFQDADQPQNIEQTANFELSGAENVSLHGNVAAGGQRVGFHIKGEACDRSGNEAWTSNTAHSSLHCIQTRYIDGHSSGCALYNDFTVYSCHQFGLIAYSSAAVMVTNSRFINNKAAIYTNVIGPASLSHVIAQKAVTVDNVLLLSRSAAFTCDDDAITPDVNRHPTSFNGILSPSGGHVGMLTPAFTSGRGHWPKAALHTIISYPAINGSTWLSGVTFAGFAGNCVGSSGDIALMTNPEADDAIHPINVKSIRWVGTPEDNKLFIQNPPLHHVNPSDCVDMDCDGHKHTLVRDSDGSFTGNSGKRTIVAKAEFEWDGDRRRGIGDYRIPKTMLTNVDGSAILPDTKYPYKGVVRGNHSDDQCEFNSVWNAYECAGLEHVMLVLESLDADTEIRRLSPIGLAANGFIDLLNGPQDHGWCGGYTCQERISTFYGIVAAGFDYQAGLTSTNPQRFRAVLLDAQEGQAITLGLIYTRPQRLDVYVNGQYVNPKNSRVKEDGQLQYIDPATDPELGIVRVSDEHGTNYYSRPQKTLYVTVSGSTPIVIEVAPVIQVSLTLAPVSETEFFEENLIANIAGLLGIDSSRIRIVNVIAESRRRRRRRQAGTQVDFEIASASSIAGNGTNTTANDTGTALTGDAFEELTNITTELVNAVQTGELTTTLNVTVLSAAVQDPEPPPMGGIRATPETGGPQPGEVDNTTMTFAEIQQMMEEEREAESQPTSYSIPTELRIFVEPSTSGQEGTSLTLQPRLAMLDGSGSVITVLGFGTLWQVSAEVVGREGVTVLDGTVDFVNGWANFSSLAISHPGSGHRLRFTVTYPSTAAFSADSAVSIDIAARPLALSIAAQPTEGYVGMALTPPFVVKLIDETTSQVVTNHGWRGRSWSVMATVVNGDQTSWTSQLVNGTAMFDSVSIATAGSFQLQFEVVTDPASLPGDTSIPSPALSQAVSIVALSSAQLRLVFDADYSVIVRGREASFKAAVLAELSRLFPNALIHNVTISEGSIIVEFTLSSASRNTILTALEYVEDLPQGGVSITFAGHNLSSSSFVAVTYTLTPAEDTAKGSSTRQYIIIGSAVGGALLVVLVAIVLAVVVYCVCGISASKKKCMVLPMDSSPDVAVEQNVYITNPSAGPFANPSPLPGETMSEEPPLQRRAALLTPLPGTHSSLPLYPSLEPLPPYPGVELQEMPTTFANPQTADKEKVPPSPPASSTFF